MKKSLLILLLVLFLNPINGEHRSSKPIMKTTGHHMETPSIIFGAIASSIAGSLIYKANQTIFSVPETTPSSSTLDTSSSLNSSAPSFLNHSYARTNTRIG